VVRDRKAHAPCPVVNTPWKYNTGCPLAIQSTCATVAVRLCSTPVAVRLSLRVCYRTPATVRLLLYTCCCSLALLSPFTCCHSLATVQTSSSRSKSRNVKNILGASDIAPHAGEGGGRHTPPSSLILTNYSIAGPSRGLPAIPFVPCLLCCPCTLPVRRSSRFLWRSLRASPVFVSANFLYGFICSLDEYSWEYSGELQRQRMGYSDGEVSWLPQCAVVLLRVEATLL